MTAPRKPRCEFQRWPPCNRQRTRDLAAYVETRATRLITHTSEIQTGWSDVGRQSSRVVISRVSRTSPNSNGQFQAREITRWWSRNKVLAINLSCRRPAATARLFSLPGTRKSPLQGPRGFPRAPNSVCNHMYRGMRNRRDTKKEKERKGKEYAVGIFLLIVVINCENFPKQTEPRLENISNGERESWIVRFIVHSAICRA